LKEAVKSVLNQGFQDFELLVVDDHSVDDTIDWLATISDQRLKVISNKSRERSAARNTGIDAAIGQYICFMDDDDLYKSSYLQDFYAYLVDYKFPRDIILRTGFEKFWEDGKTKRGVNYNQKKHRNPVYYAAYHMCGVWSLCIPCQLLANDRFDEGFPYWEDTHFVLRLLGKFSFVQLESYNYRYKIHKEMGSQKAMQKDIIIERAELNVAAIRDFFKDNMAIGEKYLDKNTERYLVAEKYLQYAINGNGVQNNLMLKSLNSKFDLRLWKGYLLYIKKQIS
jgi:glycosyltransferase involved in cell wall biosynthesis